MRHFVHIYHTFRSKFAVDADSHAEAIEKAEAMFGNASPARSGIMGMVTPAMDLDTHAAVGEGFLLSEDAEEITSFLVDEVGDTENLRSQPYDHLGQVVAGSFRNHSLTSKERDSVLAALRYWQRYGGAHTEEWEIAAANASEGLSVDEIDGLCERLNR